MLAATLSPSYGIYSGYEKLRERSRARGSEEYLHSEKYELRERALDGPLLPMIRAVNHARRAHPALQRLSNITCLETENEALIAYAKQRGEDTVVTVVNLDPQHTQEGLTSSPPSSGCRRLHRPRPAERRTLPAGAIGPNYVRLEPGVRQAHICAVESGERTDVDARRAQSPPPTTWRRASGPAPTTAARPIVRPDEPVVRVRAAVVQARGLLRDPHPWFFDANGDGSGDFRGLTEKLDYLQWLGIDCIWLLPFYESPLRDGGYDIADFYAVHPDYGTVEDVRRADRCGARPPDPGDRRPGDEPHLERSPLVPEYAVGPDNPKRDWYVWSDTDDTYQDARIIFIDTESSNWTWDPVAGQYYWHRFFSHQPDLNYDNPEVREAMLEVLRLLAGHRRRRVPARRRPVPVRARGHELREPAGDARLPRESKAIDADYPDRVLLAEANQWPEDVVEYFGRR